MLSRRNVRNEVCVEATNVNLGIRALIANGNALCNETHQRLVHFFSSADIPEAFHNLRLSELAQRFA